MAGAGTRRDAELVLERIPRGHYTAIDGSNDMLGVLRQRLGPYGNRVTVIEADLNKPLLAAQLLWAPESNPAR